MSWYLTFPLMLPFATAVLAFLFRNTPSGRWISVCGSFLGLLSAIALLLVVNERGILSAQMGMWAAPFGITLVADLLSAAMVFLTAGIGLAVAIYALADISPRIEKHGYHALFQILIGGVTGAFLTGDLFNLYVWFEVMLIASFGLLILGGTAAQIDGAVKYVTLNLVSTILFLSGIGMLYGVTGTLNMADLGISVAASDKQSLLNILAMMFLIAFGVKAALFPLFFWLPASYHTPAFSVSAVFAALLTKVGVYSIYRVFTLIFAGDSEFLNALLLWVAALTMLVGALGALAQTDIRRILSFQVVSSIGFLILGLALDSPLAMAGALFYLFHNIIVKANLFMSAGVIHRLAGSSDLGSIGGLYKSVPLLAFLFFIPALSLGGIPPLSGFWPKVMLVKASLDEGQAISAAVALIAGLLTIYSMMRVWAEAFWKPHPDDFDPDPASLGNAQGPLMGPMLVLGALTVFMGIFPEPIVEYTQRAANQLLSPEAYIASVMGVQE